MMKKPMVYILVYMLVIGGMTLSVSGTVLRDGTSYSSMNLKGIKTETMNAGDMAYFNMSLIAELGQAAWGITTADFNNDGYMDFAVASATSPFSFSTISIFYNDGTAVFTKQNVFTYPYYFDSLNAGDYNNDGAVDFLFGYSESIDYYAVYGVVCLLVNDGNNNFNDPIQIIKQGSGKREPFGRINPKISSGDYDLDGDIDFILGDNSGKIELFYNDGAGMFTSGGIIHDWGRVSWGVASADFDSDGDVDFLVSAEPNVFPYSGVIYLKLNRKASNNFLPIFNKGRGELIAYPDVLCGSLAPLDYDKDGDMDFIAGEMNNLDLYISDQGKYFPCSIGYLPDYEDLHQGAIASADFNNDGYADFITGGTQGVVRLFLNTNEEPFGAMITKPLIRHVNIYDTTMPFPTLKRTVVIGPITVKVQPFGEVTKVEFFLNSVLQYSDTELPFEWIWDTPSSSEKMLQIVVWDDSGNSYQEFMSVWRLQR